MIALLRVPTRRTLPKKRPRRRPPKRWTDLIRKDVDIFPFYANAANKQSCHSEEIDRFRKVAR